MAIKIYSLLAGQLCHTVTLLREIKSNSNTQKKMEKGVGEGVFCGKFFTACADYHLLPNYICKYLHALGIYACLVLEKTKAGFFWGLLFCLLSTQSSLFFSHVGGGPNQDPCRIPLVLLIHGIW